MRYIVDLDAFVECLDCLHSVNVNGKDYICVALIKEFVDRFPKEPIDHERTAGLSTV